MNRPLLILALLFALRGTAFSVEANPETDSAAKMRARARAFLEEPRFASATWGIDVISLESGETLLEWNASKLLKPASNAKLFTAALVLDTLGPAFRIRTSVYADAAPGACDYCMLIFETEHLLFL